MNSFRFPNLQAWPRSRRGLEQHQPVHPHSPCWHSSQGKRWEKGIGYSRINCCHFSSLAFFASSRCLWSCWNRWSSAATATHLCGATRNWLFCGVFGGCQLRGYDLRPQTTIKSQQISKKSGQKVSLVHLRIGKRSPASTSTERRLQAQGCAVLCQGFPYLEASLGREKNRKSRH